MNRRPNILIVDDEHSSRETLSDILEARGYTIYSADCGQRAIDKVETNDIDLLLMDYKMPDLNGLDTFRLINLNHPDIKAVFITAYYDEKSLQTEKHSQILGIFHKPVNIAELMKLLDGLAFG